MRSQNYLARDPHNIYIANTYQTPNQPETHIQPTPAYPKTGKHQDRKLRIQQRHTIINPSQPTWPITNRYLTRLPD